MYFNILWEFVVCVLKWCFGDENENLLLGHGEDKERRPYPLLKLTKLPTFSMSVKALAGISVQEQ